MHCVHNTYEAAYLREVPAQITHLSEQHWALKRVSLIAGLKYGMERWNGKWNGTVNVHSYNQLVYLALLGLG